MFPKPPANRPAGSGEQAFLLAPPRRLGLGHSGLGPQSRQDPLWRQRIQHISLAQPPAPRCLYAVLDVRQVAGAVGIGRNDHIDERGTVRLLIGLEN